MSSMRVIVTGATSSIGQHIASELGRKGFAVGLLGRDSRQLEALRRNISGVEAIQTLDMEHGLSEVSEKVSELCYEVGDVEAVISTHGQLRMSPLRSSTLNEWDTALRVNLLSNLELLKAFRNYRVESKSPGRVIIFSSVASSRGSGGLSTYSVTKSAMESLVRSAALEFARDKIKVNSIQLGLLETGMGKQIRDKIGDQRFADLRNVYPLGLGHERDALGAVEFLLSDQSNWITGTNLVVDGGYSVV